MNDFTRGYMRGYKDAQKEALSAERVTQPEQEHAPLLEFYEYEWQGETHKVYRWLVDIATIPSGTKLYTIPPQRKPLMGEQLIDSVSNEQVDSYCWISIEGEKGQYPEMFLTEDGNQWRSEEVLTTRDKGLVCTDWLVLRGAYDEPAPYLGEWEGAAQWNAKVIAWMPLPAAHGIKGDA